MNSVKTFKNTVCQHCIFYEGDGEFDIGFGCVRGWCAYHESGVDFDTKKNKIDAEFVCEDKLFRDSYYLISNGLPKWTPRGRSRAICAVLPSDDWEKKQSDESWHYLWELFTHK